MSATTRRKYRIVFSFKANSSVNIPIIFAFVGFFYAIILFLPNRSGKHQYHDLQLVNKQELVTNMLTKKATQLEQLYHAHIPFANLKDTAVAKDNFNKVRHALRQTKNELYQLQHGNADTNLDYYVKYLSMDRKQLYRAINKLKGKQSTSALMVPVVMRDIPVLVNTPYAEHQDNLKIIRADTSFVQFISTYPSFGFWYFLSIAQMAFWFLLLALMIGNMVKTNDILQYNYPYTIRNSLAHLGIPLAIFLLFSYLFYDNVIDEHVVVDSFFLDGFTNKMIWYSVPGYAIAIYCFSTYLFLSNKLELLDILSQPQGAAAGANQLDDYNRLKSAFEFSFFCSAFILSLFVFYLGTLFHATNNMEVMRFYSLLSGKPFIIYDFVYLVGLMHSLILLIFYIPVRLRFNRLNLTKAENAANDTSASKKYIRQVWDSLGSILVTISPLLATFAERIIAMLLN